MRLLRLSHVNPGTLLFVGLALAACGLDPAIRAGEATVTAGAGQADTPPSARAITAQSTPTDAIIAERRLTAVPTVTVQARLRTDISPARAIHTAAPEIVAAVPKATPTTPRTLVTVSPPPTPTPMPTPTASPTPAPALRGEVGRIATSRSVDGLQRPDDETDTFDPGERVYISIEFRNVREGAVLGFRWKADAGCAGMYETPPQRPIRRGWFGFHIDRTNCVGPFVVEVTVDGAQVGEAQFRIGS